MEQQQEFTAKRGNIFQTRLNQLMNDTNTTHSALAEHLNLTRQAVSSYLDGKAFPTLEKFYKIEMTDDLYFKIKNGSIIKNNYNHDIVAFTKNDKVIAIYKEYSKDRTLLKPWKMFL